MLLVDPPFLCLLAWRETGERSGWDIFGDHRTRRNPSVVSDLDRCLERIVDTGPDVAPDPRLSLPLGWVVGEVRGDVACGDVRILADLRIPNVGQMRHLRACPDQGFLDLDEGADLCVLADHGSRPDVGEGSDLGAARDPHRSAKVAEGLD